MRQIKLTGREASIVRAIGFAEGMSGAEIQDYTHMQPEDVLDTLNGLLSAGLLETVPFYEQVNLAGLSTTNFEMNPAYAHELKTALYRR